MSKLYFGNARFKTRTDTAENWNAENPVLLEGEMGIVTDGTDNEWLKVGDGVTAWNSLEYKKAIADQTYDSESENAQSGKAVHTAVSESASQAANALRAYKATTSSLYLKDLSPVPHKISLTVKPLNLLQESYWTGASNTTNGITWTVNANKTVTANGTATANSYFYLWNTYSSNKPVLPKGTYTFSAAPQGGSFSVTYGAQLNYNNIKLNEGGNGITATFAEEENTINSVYLVIHEGVTVENLTFMPMLTIGTEKKEYASPNLDVTPATVTVSDSIAGYYEDLTPSEDGSIEISTADFNEEADKREVSLSLSSDDYYTLFVKYNRDINKAFEELQKEIISLGGNI